MSVMLDIIGSSVIIGLVIMTILGMNVNISDETYKGLTEFNLQTQSIQLSRIVEFDFYKIGYAVDKPGIIAIADSSHIKFYTNLFNIAGHKDSVEYNLYTYVNGTSNPRDRMLYRYENTTKVFINYSVTRFKMSYYNMRDSLLAAPVTGSMRDSIHSIKVYLTLENPEPFDSTRSGGPRFIGTYYAKWIYPRNL